MSNDERILTFGEGLGGPCEEAGTKGLRKLPWGKRVGDIGLSLFMLAASSPLTLLIVLAIKLEDGGPIFFRQERWGRGLRKFKVLKFRTMVPNTCSTMARPNDPRVTRVGKVLRATGLDELPQILNILKGDMSFVGTRALAINEVLHCGNAARYEDLPGFEERLSVRPGLTSLATTFIPKDTNPRRKFRYDLLYVRRLSLKLDLYLILVSYWISFTGGWEKRDGKILGKRGQNRA